MLLAWLSWGALELQAQQGVLRTTAGTNLKGLVALADGGVSVQPESGGAVTVPVGEWSELILRTTSAVTTSTNTTSETNTAALATSQVAGASGSEEAPIPSGWNRARIGPGADGAVVGGGVDWVLRGKGAGLRGNSDEFLFLEQRMDLSGQLMSAVAAFAATNAEAAGGIMLRDNLGEAAAYAFLGQRGAGGITFQYRQIAGGMTMRVTNAVIAFPAWVRLSRLGGSVMAEVSSDGRSWNPFGQANVNLGGNVRAGLAVTSGASEVEVVVGFRPPTVGAGGSGYAPAAGYPRLVMRGGSILVAPIESADDAVVRLGGFLSGSMVSLLNVARIEFLAPTPEFEARWERDRPGLILSDGDFLDGTVRAVATNILTMNSLLLGFRRFPIGSQAAAVQVGEVEPEAAAFRVLLRNGSELRARTVEPGKQGLRVESPLLGALVLSLDQVDSIRRTAEER